jgi:ferredoxin/flavodoxin---NADP+ reductase
MSSTGPAQASIGKLSYRQDIAPDLAIIRLQPADGGLVPDFKAGQFVTLGLQFPSEDRVTNRAYSISSPPEERRYYELYIKLAREPVVGKFTGALFEMKIGDTLYWRKPAGVFTIEEKRIDGSADDRTLVLVASGTGLAPFVSYILHLQNIGSKRKVVLLHGVRYAKELGYRDIFEGLANKGSNFVYIPTVSRPENELSSGWKGYTGRVEALLDGATGQSTLEKTLGHAPSPADSFFHICGYQGTIDAVSSALKPLGFVTNKNRRADGSFDIKIESYG